MCFLIFESYWFLSRILERSMITTKRDFDPKCTFATLLGSLRPFKGQDRHEQTYYHECIHSMRLLLFATYFHRSNNINWYLNSERQPYFLTNFQSTTINIFLRYGNFNITWLDRCHFVHYNTFIKIFDLKIDTVP